MRFSKPRFYGGGSEYAGHRLNALRICIGFRPVRLLDVITEIVSVNVNKHTFLYLQYIHIIYHKSLQYIY